MFREVSVSLPRIKKWKASNRVTRYDRHLKSYSTAVDLRQSRSNEQKCQRQRDDASSSFDDSNQQTSRCPAAFLTPVFTGLQAGCQTQTNTEAH